MNNSLQSRESLKCKWYLNVFFVWVWILSFGPLAIPFLIMSPKFGRTSKIIISLVLLLLTYYFYQAGMQVYALMQNPQELKKVLGSYLSAEQMEMLDLLLDTYTK